MFVYVKLSVYIFVRDYDLHSLVTTCRHVPVFMMRKLINYEQNLEINNIINFATESNVGNTFFPVFEWFIHSVFIVIYFIVINYKAICFKDLFIFFRTNNVFYILKQRYNVMCCAMLFCYPH